MRIDYFVFVSLFFLNAVLGSVQASSSHEDFADKDQPVRALFDSKVLSVHVNEKQWINKYDLICVVEIANKMTMNIPAPQSGYIHRIAVSPLSQVQKNDELAVMTPTLPEMQKSEHHAAPETLSTHVPEDDKPNELINDSNEALDPIATFDANDSAGRSSLKDVNHVWSDVKSIRSNALVSSHGPETFSIIIKLLEKQPQLIIGRDTHYTQQIEKSFSGIKSRHHVVKPRVMQHQNETATDDRIESKDLSNAYRHQGVHSIVLSLKDDIRLLKIAFLNWDWRAFQRVCWCFVFALSLLLAQDDMVVRRIYRYVVGRFQKNHDFMFDVSLPYEIKQLNQNMDHQGFKRRYA